MMMIVKTINLILHSSDTVLSLFILKFQFVNNFRIMFSSVFKTINRFSKSLKFSVSIFWNLMQIFNFPSFIL